MPPSQLIQRRLQELSQRAGTILSARTTVSLVRNKTTDVVSRPEAIAWGTNVISLFQQAFGDSSVHTRHFQDSFRQFGQAYASSFELLKALFEAAKEDFEGGYIFSFQGLVKAEVLADALEQARELINAQYKDPACVLVGVSLEVAVKHLAQENGVTLGKLDRMNSDLGKSGVYNMAKQKQVTAWADLRNRAAHGEWSTYTLADVEAMHAGVQQFVADLL